MANTALLGLTSLLEMQEQGQAAAANQQKLQEARSEFVAPEDGEAGFALPEALATGIGAAWVLGPAGLLLGVAQGILGKREQQSAIDAYAQEMGVLDETNQIFNDELDRMALGVTNPDDLAQLSALQTQKDAAMKLSASASPESQALGQDMMSQFATGLNEYAVRQEQQQIEQQVREAQAARDLGVQQKSDWMSLLDDYDAQSGNYEQTMMSGNQALKMIERGNPVDIVAALIQVNKTLDPTSVVRPEEARALVAGGDLLEQAMRKVEEWAGSGLPLKADDRAELIELVQGLQKDATAFQMQRDIRFQNRAVKLDLPSDYVQEFRLVNNLPAFKPLGLQENKGDMQKTKDGALQWLEDNVSDDALLNKVAHTIGLDSYEPASIEEQAKRNPRVRRATR